MRTKLPLLDPSAIRPLSSSLLERELHPFWTVKNSIRIFFGALLVFEALNMAGIIRSDIQFTWLGLFLTALAVWGILEFIAYRYALHRGAALHSSLWVLAALSLALDAGGDMFHLYERFFWWDSALHLFSSGVACIVFFVIVSSFAMPRGQGALSIHEKLRIAIFFAMALAMTTGALYEIEEYAEDLVFGSNRLGLGTDTANDLMFDAIGVLLAGVILRLAAARKARLTNVLEMER